MNNNRYVTGFLLRKWSCLRKLLLLSLIMFVPQQLWAEDKFFSPGEELTLTADVTWDNLFSQTTKDNWAIVTGPFNITVTGTTDINFVSFQNTGSISFENETIIEKCVFDGNTTLSIGTLATQLSSKIIIEENDFRNQVDATVLTISSMPGDSTGTYRIKGNSFYYTTKKVILLQKRNGCLFTENVVHNMELGNLSGANWNIAGGHTYSKNFLSSERSVTNYRTLAVNGGTPPIIFDNNYCYYDFLNPHPFTFTNSGSTGTDYYTNNILEVEFHFDGANLFTSNSSRPVDVSHNIHIGSGSLCNAVGDNPRKLFSIKNNTCFSTLAGNSGDGMLYLSEGGPSAGTVNIMNNIVTGLTNPGAAVNSITGVQSITHSDYNVFYNVTSPYQNIVISSGQVRDITYDPIFVEPSRNLFAWDASKGGAGTKTSVINAFVKMNGYNEITKLQSDTPSGYLPEDLIGWVRHGFTPTNKALQGAGECDDDPGAIGL